MISFRVMELSGVECSQRILSVPARRCAGNMSIKPDKAIRGLVEFDHMAKRGSCIDKGEAGACGGLGILRQRDARLVIVRNRLLKIVHKNGKMVQAEAAAALRVEIVIGARVSIMLLHEFDHHLAPLAIGTAMIEQSRNTPVFGANKRNMVKNEEGARAKCLMVRLGCRPNVRHEIGDLANRQRQFTALSLPSQ